MFSVRVFSQAIIHQWINLNTLNIHRSLYKVGSCKYTSIQQTKNSPGLVHNEFASPVSVHGAIVDSSIHFFLHKNDISLWRFSVVCIFYPVDLHSVESSQSHLPHLPAGDAILRSICHLPVSTLVALFLQGSGRRRQFLNINFHDRSSFKNKFSSLSIEDQARERLNCALPSYSLRIQISLPCFCFNFC